MTFALLKLPVSSCYCAICGLKSPFSFFCLQFGQTVKSDTLQMEKDMEVNVINISCKSIDSQVQEQQTGVEK